MAKLDPAAQRAFALEVVERLRAAGFESYWAGGCVRDQLLGRTPKDYDVATAARPEQIRTVFGQRRTLPLGAAFGVITVLGPRAAGPIEVATFRQDAGYSDGRRPDSVAFSTAEADAQRRDFTINGLFYDPQAARVIDFVGGQADLAAGILRAIGDPPQRFSEDKLRLLRAVRFAAAFGFQLDDATRQAIQAMAGQISVISAERIASELRRMLVDPSRRAGLELLREVGLLPPIAPELAGSLAGPTGEHDWAVSLGAAALLDQPSFPLALATVTHRLLAPQALADWSLRLKLSNAESNRAVWLLENFATVERARQTPWPRLQRVLIHPGAEELLALAEVDALVAGSHSADVQFCRRQLALPAAELNPPPLLTGADLIAHGLSPGPEFQRLLELVRDAQLEKRVSTRQEALALIDAARP